MSEIKLFRPDSFEREFCFESYGVNVRIQSNDAKLLDNARDVVREALVGQAKFIEKKGIDVHQSYEFALDPAGECFLYQDGEYVTRGEPGQKFLKFFNSILRVAIGERAVSKVFLHAGVVAWRDKAIVMPANSFRGKTTLVSELVRCGATYYSDEYAILDEAGLVHPFSRRLSIRYVDGMVREKDVPVEAIGGRAGFIPIEVGMVLLTEHRQNARWKPEILSHGRGIIEVVPHALPMNVNPGFTLRVLDAATRNSVFVKSYRGEAKRFAARILGFFDNCYF
jgi:hypothetical protein